MHLKVAVVQVGSVLFDTEACIAKLETYARRAADQGAKLAVFPEAFLGGYPKGLTFGASVGIRTPEGREWFKTYAQSAVEIPGPITHQLERRAKETGLHLITGVVERSAGTLYCAAIGVSPQGLFLHHRKIMPTAAERIIWGMGDGSSLRVEDTPLGKIGTLICWENYMPLARMALYQQAMQLHCVLTVDDRETWIPTLRHLAREGRCFVLSSCQYLTQDSYPPELRKTLPMQEKPVIRGGSCIIDPMGEIVVQPNYEGEALLFAELDMDDIIRGKYDLDVAGHSARPDIFSFNINPKQ